MTIQTPTYRIEESYNCYCQIRKTTTLGFRVYSKQGNMSTQVAVCYSQLAAQTIIRCLQADQQTMLENGYAIG